MSKLSGVMLMRDWDFEMEMGFLVDDDIVVDLGGVPPKAHQYGDCVKFSRSIIQQLIRFRRHLGRL